MRFFVTLFLCDCVALYGHHWQQSTAWYKNRVSVNQSYSLHSHRRMHEETPKIQRLRLSRVSAPTHVPHADSVNGVSAAVPIHNEMRQQPQHRRNVVVIALNLGQWKELLVMPIWSLHCARITFRSIRRLIGIDAGGLWASKAREKYIRIRLL